MVIDKNRIFIGLLILLFFLIGYLLKLDLLILLIIFFLITYELYKLSFIENIYEYIILISFIFLIPVIFFNNHLVNFMNIFLILFVAINLILPSFFLKRLFLLIVLIFVCNFFAIFLLDRNFFYFVIFVAFLNDTIAYVFGNLIKGPLIIPKISPKKTWSGTIVSFIVTFIIIYQFNFSFLISIALSISLFFGDLFFSYIKRILNLKDFSNILQGHGGILDRLDSMIFFLLIFNFNNL